ncbi:pyridoxamine 5'-phosphate oxidase family protein [Nonomuraea mesophila]|nr:pyridoxamine 5'-phosphate oxidase family protein [Nonomuraea mesophila]
MEPDNRSREWITMADWEALRIADGAMAELGRKIIDRLSIAYLATVTADGWPRVHPVCPFFHGTGIYVGLIETSPKCRDLLRDGRYVLHALPGPSDAEFWLRGRARAVDDGERAELARAEHGAIPDTSRVFELLIATAHTAVYRPGENDLPAPTRRRWAAALVERAADA